MASAKINNIPPPSNSDIAKEIRTLEFHRRFKEGKKAKSDKNTSTSIVCLTRNERNKLKFYRSLYENMCWEEFNKVIKIIKRYVATEMYNNTDVPERVLLSNINEELLGFKNMFAGNCASRGIPIAAVRKTHAFRIMTGLTHSYKSHSKLTGHKRDDNKIYYKNSKANLNTRHNMNKVSYFKLKLSQADSCGTRKVKNTPFAFTPFKFIED